MLAICRQLWGDGRDAVLQKHQQPTKDKQPIARWPDGWVTH